MKWYSNKIYIIHPKLRCLLPEQFRNFILDSKVQATGFKAACGYRERLLSCHRTIEGKVRDVSEIVKSESTRPILGGVIQKIEIAFGIRSVLELGTSLGVGTMYMATAAPDVRVTTIDCNSRLLDFTTARFKETGVKNVEFVCDRIEDWMAGFVEGKIDSKFDLVFVDGDHRGEAMLRQFELITGKLVGERYIIVFDDINYNKDMFTAWRHISNMCTDSLRINLFRWGMIFHGYELPKREMYARIKLGHPREFV